MVLPDSFDINLKPSNKSMVQGCPGVPKTYVSNVSLYQRIITNVF